MQRKGVFFLDSTFYLDIKKILLAHEYVLDLAHRCEYRGERGSYGLVYVIRGEAKYIFSSGERVTLRPGDVFFISPTSAYSISCDCQFLHYTVNFMLNPWNAEASLLPAPYLHLEGASASAFAQMFARIVSLWQEKQFAYEMLCMSQLYELLALLYREFRGSVENAYHRLLPARAYIDAHFAEDFTLDDLARLCHMSLTNFRREWKKHFSDTPMQYRDRQRLALAKEYLHGGYYSIGEIATRCGFEDASYFIRFFKKNVGTPPKEFQRRQVE